MEIINEIGVLKQCFAGIVGIGLGLLTVVVYFMYRRKKIDALDGQFGWLGPLPLLFQVAAIDITRQTLEKGDG